MIARVERNFPGEVAEMANVRYAYSASCAEMFDTDSPKQFQPVATRCCAHYALNQAGLSTGEAEGSKALLVRYGKYQAPAIANAIKPPIARPIGPNRVTKYMSKVRVIIAVSTKFQTCGRTIFKPLSSMACKAVHSRAMKYTATAAIKRVGGAAAEPTQS